MAESKMTANEIAKAVGEFALRLLFDQGSRAMYVLFVADEMDEPGLFGRGAVVSNLDRPIDIKVALQHAATEYDIAADIEILDMELPQ